MTGAINGDFTFVQKTPWLPYFEAATVDYSVWLIGLTVGPQVVAIEFWVEGFNFTPAGIATARVENNTMTGLSVARIGVQTGPGRFTGTKTTSGGSVKRGTH